MWKIARCDNDEFLPPVKEIENVYEKTHPRNRSDKVIKKATNQIEYLRTGQPVNIRELI